MKMLSISLLLVIVLVSSGTCQIRNHYGKQDYEMSSWTMPNISPYTPVQVYHHPYYYNQPIPPTTTTTTIAPPPAPVPVNNVQYGNYYSPPSQLYYPAPALVPAQVRVSFSDNAPYPKSPPQQKYQSPTAPIIPIIQFDQEIKEGEFNRFHFISANGIEEEQETLIQKYPESSASNYNYGPNGQNVQNPGNGYNNNNNYNNGDGHPGCLLIKRGKYSYVSPEGQLVQMQWIADSNGFRPQGSQTRQLNYR